MNFDHLDPAVIPDPDDGALSQIKRAAAVRRHRLLGGAGAALAVVVALIALAVAGGGSPAKRLTTDHGRLPAAGDGFAESDTPTTGTTGSTPPSEGAGRTSGRGAGARTSGSNPSSKAPSAKASGIVIADSRGLVLMDPDGSHQRVILPPQKGPYYDMGFDTADWSPDRSRIVTFANEKYGGRDYSLTPEGQAVTALGITGAAAISPDGKRLAVAAFDNLIGAGSSSSNGALFVSDADGNGARRLAPSMYAENLRKPSWTPDGSRILFAGNVDLDSTTTTTVVPAAQSNGYSLWSIKPDGSDLQRMSGFDGVSDPAFSPDGASVAFVKYTCTPQVAASEPPCKNAQIYVANLDGTNVHRVTHDSGEDVRPVWSPDGARLAFAGEPEPCHSCGDAWAVFTMNADGSNLTRVADAGSPLAWG